MSYRIEATLASAEMRRMIGTDLDRAKRIAAALGRSGLLEVKVIREREDGDHSVVSVHGPATLRPAS
jgi:hypothetical protein